MPPVTDFAVKDPYSYLYGLGNYHSSEALPGANSPVNNSPQKPPYSLRTERISGTSFTAPRQQTLQTWLYRITSSLDHSDFVLRKNSARDEPQHLTPNAYMWPTLPAEPGLDWIDSQKLLGSIGDPAKKAGCSMWIFSACEDMQPNTAFSSLDGDLLIIPQAGALDLQTELGSLLVRQNEFAVIPRGVRYRVTLPAGPCRGYLCELFQGHFQLPDLGIVGSTGLANVRDFEIPTARFEGKLNGDAVEAKSGDWTIVSRLNGQLWECRQDHTPFDVVAWHGTNYPYKYDLAKFCVLGNVLFDEHDPSLYVVLTAPSYSDPGSAVVDFALIPPRWQVSESTFWLPYYHRNTMSEYYGPIINTQDPSHPFNKTGHKFAPFGAGLNGNMATHGAAEDEYQRAVKDDLTPKKVMNDGMSIFLLETELPLRLTNWAEESGVKNLGSRKPKAMHKM